MQSWYALETSEVAAHLRTGLTGLSTDEARLRLERHGPNELEAPRRVSPWSLLLAQFRNVLILILLVAVVLSAVLGHTVEAVAITAIVLLAVLLGFYQEFRAERAIEALTRMAAPLATVLRDGEEADIPAREVAPGDVMLLAAGQRVPADGRVTQAVNLRVDEATLTGESSAVTKSTAPLPDPNRTIGDRLNMVHAGTLATYGRGRAIVVATGMQTEFGLIARLLQAVETRRTPLQDNLDRVGRALARAALVVVAIIVGLGLWRGEPFLQMFIFGIALAVAAVPEALPAVVAITLAMGLQRMARRNVLIRRLPAVEALGSTSMICSDKTGTLTKDEMTLRLADVDREEWGVSGAGYEPLGTFTRDGEGAEPSDALRELLRAAALASDAHVVRAVNDGRWHLHGDPTEGALVVAAAKSGLHKPELDVTFRRVAEIPFSSESKRMTTLHTMDGALMAYAKGAPEVIVASCTTRLRRDGTVVPLDAASRAAVLTSAHDMAARAFRVLAVSRKPGATLETAEDEMTLLGLVGMSDPPRPEVPAAVATCQHAGIGVVMITGDHPLTAKAVAQEIGLLRVGRVVTGVELERMSDQELAQEAPDIEVFARISPALKLRIVSAFQDRGHVVAMTGDGVNDAPALKKADIGVAMGITGTDVSKEAAAMTLTDDNFASIVAAVEEGRAVFDNIKKFLMFLLSANIGEIALMLVATLAGLPLPLTAVQILFVNLATDGLPALALAVDPADRDLMRRPPRDPKSGLFTRSVVTLMTIGGLWSAMVNVGLFVWALQSGRTVQQAMAMTFVSLILIQFFQAYNSRSDWRSILDRPFANRWLNLAILSQLVLTGLVVYAPPLQRAFGTFALSLVEWLIISGLASTVTTAIELAKWILRRQRVSPRAAASSQTGGA